MAGRPNPFPMGVSDLFPAGYMIWFGSLEFRATGNSYLMERLPPRVSSDVLAPPPRHQRRTGWRARQARIERRRVAPPAPPRTGRGKRATNWCHRGRHRPFAINTDSDADRRHDKATALPLWDAVLCHDLRVICQHRHERVRGFAWLSSALNTQPHRLRPIARTLAPRTRSLSPHEVA